MWTSCTVSCRGNPVVCHDARRHAVLAVEKGHQAGAAGVKLGRLPLLVSAARVKKPLRRSRMVSAISPAMPRRRAP